ncbi:hypothetical protein [Micromonospora sp. NBC_01813]|uniref:hypothetical protein n=1 Tax=Micromonospora sp. NBC_01813 TaxID=2975988 RepID=UPI002DD9A423|nr:hypothetical protein [Micromonospora sp. NBC_01813]WSA11911.1 hypothetical protein OG958_14660 [Micromonospora sp. NBC_01813]
MSIRTVDLLDGRGYNGATLLLAVAALICAIAAAYFAREALFPPRRRLVVRVLPPVPLSQEGGLGVAVSHEGRSLPDPHVVTVLLRNTGRHAIATTHFDRDRPISVDINATIEAILSPTDLPAASGVRFERTTALFDPELIRPKQEIAVQLLTSGKPDPGFTVTEYLVDTRVDVEGGGPDPQPAVALEQGLPVAFAVAGTVFALVTLIIANLPWGG